MEFTQEVQTARSARQHNWSFPNCFLVSTRSDGKQREYIDNRGLHVIVGRYKGGDEPGAGADVPDDLLDTNDFKPDPKSVSHRVGLTWT